MNRSRGPRWRGAEDQTKRCDQVLEVLADRARVPQIVVVLDERVNERLVLRAANLSDLEGTDLMERCHERLLRQVDWWSWSLPRQWRLVRPARGRKQDMAGAMELEHEHPAHRVARDAVRLFPIPSRAHLERQPAPADIRSLRDQLPHESDVVGADVAASVAQDNHHGRWVSSPASERKGVVTSSTDREQRAAGSRPLSSERRVGLGVDGRLIRAGCGAPGLGPLVHREARPLEQERQLSR